MSDRLAKMRERIAELEDTVTLYAHELERAGVDLTYRPAQAQGDGIERGWATDVDRMTQIRRAHAGLLRGRGGKPIPPAISRAYVAMSGLIGDFERSEAENESLRAEVARLEKSKAISR